MTAPAPAGELRVVLVDDHDLFRRGLRELLEGEGLRVVGEAADGEEAVRLAVHAAPDVLVMDLGLPRTSGVEATRRLAAEAPGVRVVALTVEAEEATVLAARASRLRRRGVVSEGLVTWFSSRRVRGREPWGPPRRRPPRPSPASGGNRP